MSVKIETDSHKCQLDNILDTGLPELRPGAGLLERWKRILQEQLLVSPDHPTCKFYFKSNAAILSEKRRQMRHFPCSIHPFSRVSLYREMVMSLVWFFEFVTGPIFSAYYRPLDFSRDLWHHIDLIAEICFLVNVLLCFFIGVKEDQTKTVELKVTKVAKHYLRTFFLFDFVGTLPIAYMLRRFRRHIETYPITLSISYFLHVSRFTRLNSAIRYFRLITLKCGITEVVHELICLGIKYLLCVHWCSCYVYLLPKALFHFARYRFHKSLWLYRSNITLSHRGIKSSKVYLLSLRVAFCHILGVSMGDVAQDEPLDYVFFSIVSIIGFFLTIYVMAKIFLIVKATYASESEYEELLQEFIEYGNRKRIPIEMKNRVIQYLEHNYQQHYFQENIIVNTLSNHLRVELFLYDCKRIVERVHVFQAFSRSTVGLLISFLKREVYFKNDVVTKIGQSWDAVHFILYGTTIFILKNGVELFHDYDGDSLGLLGLILNTESHLGSIIAVEICEMYKLDKNDLYYCIEQDREIYNVLYATAKERQKKILNMLYSSTDETTKSITHQLRKGRILEHQFHKLRRAQVSRS